ncbi:MAG TPA: hypothetical protein VHM26_07875 [Chitinophagaceae bacterium]|jgi:hypothetical protein|nr:hypothetical protein [Chitinophagaceae bacterium]
MLLRLIFSVALLCAAIYMLAQNNVGVGTTSPTQRLHVNGKIKVGDDVASPSAGTIRWNAARSDFEGFNGNEWLSLTQGKQAGTIGGLPGEIGQLVDYNAGPAPQQLASGQYGSTVDISGEWAVVGAPSQGRGGAAHVFHKEGNEWKYFSSLTSTDIGNKDRYGSAVAIDGTNIIVGAPYDSLGNVEYNGSAYIFSYNGSAWVQQMKITNPITTGVRDFFGDAVDISGDMAIIGAQQADDGPNADEGRAYVFKRVGAGPTWSSNGVFTCPGGMAGAYFGTSVSIYGSYIAIGASFFDLPDGLGAIFVYLFNGTSWTFQQRLTSSDPANEQFGYSVALDNATIAVGARARLVEYSGQGAAYVFFRSGTLWTQQAFFTIPKTNSFGNSVAVSGNYLIIGAPDTRLYETCGTIAIGIIGKAFVYKRTGTAWERFLTMDMPGVNDGDQFGVSVAIDGDAICAGAPGTDVNGVENAGKVIFGRLQ